MVYGAMLALTVDLGSVDVILPPRVVGTSGQIVEGKTQARLKCVPSGTGGGTWHRVQVGPRKADDH